jgi:hypothetical protein
MCRAFAASLFLMLAGCNTAKLTPRSDEDASCGVLVEYPCKAEAPTAEGCTANPATTDPLEARIAPDASYAGGCILVVPQLAPDEQGECAIEGTCRCLTDAGAPHWYCTPP